jgi:hypothetical protein
MAGVPSDSEDDGMELAPLSQGGSTRPLDFNTPRDMADWPVALLRRVLERHEKGQDHVMNRLSDFVRCGLVCQTRFSGRFTTETMLRMLGVALREIGICVRDDWFVSFGACDRDTTCQAIWKNGLSKNLKPMHYFSTLQDTLGSDHKAMVESLRPEETETEEEKLAAYQLQEDYLVGNRDACFKGIHVAGCKAHPNSSSCPVTWDGTCEQLGVRQGFEDAVYADFSGPVCTPFSKCGKRQKLADPNTESATIYAVGTAAQSRMDIKTIENVSGLIPSLEKFTKHYEVEDGDENCSAHHIAHHVHNATGLGFPTSRSRLSLTAINEERWVWVGPIGKEAIGKEFDMLFKGVCNFTIDTLIEFRVTREQD